MRRRGFILMLAGAAQAMLPGCAQPRDPRGLVDIKWGRDSCAHCGMVLSDFRFAAQAIGLQPREHWVFDDVGCAAAWLDSRPAAEQAALRLWVAPVDSKSEAVAWLDARDARFREARGSPMGYDFGAMATLQPGSLAFEALRERVRARRMCRT